MLILFFAAVLAGLVFQKSKAITAIQLIICLLIFSFNTDNPDYQGYLGTYNSIQTGGIFFTYLQRYDLLYKAIVYAGNHIGLNFNYFRAFLFAGCSLLILSGIKNFTQRTSFVLSLYMLFPFVMDCIQIRNFIAEAIIFFSMRYLICTEDILQKRTRIIKYTLCVIAAAMFHYVSAFYLVYLIVFFEKDFRKLYAGAMIGIVGAILLLKVRTSISYLQVNVSAVTFVFLTGISIGIIILVYYAFRKKDCMQIYDSMGANSVYYRFLVASTLFLPILFFQYDMFRFIRNIFLVFSSMAGFYISELNSHKETFDTVFLSVIAVSLLFAAAYGLLMWRSAVYPYDVPLLHQMINSI